MLVLAFNRPVLVRELLQSLPTENVSCLFISIDGPRNDHDKLKADEIVGIARDFSKFVPVLVRRSSVNLGCRLGVISGLDWFYNESIDGGLVLEDDCFPKQEFFEFLNLNIPLINTREVAMISAHNPLMEIQIDKYKSRFIFINGWFMASSTWQTIRNSIFAIRPPSRFTESGHRRSRSEAMFWWATYARARIGLHDTWDSLFYRAFSENGFECLVPKKNMVENRGFGEGATHTTDPDGTIFFDDVFNVRKSLNSSEELDNLISRQYFKIRKRHMISPIFRVLVDFLKVRKFPDYNKELKLAEAKFLRFGKDH